jgi:hypothetical protein
VNQGSFDRKSELHIINSEGEESHSDLPSGMSWLVFWGWALRILSSRDVVGQQSLRRSCKETLHTDLCDFVKSTESNGPSDLKDFQYPYVRELGILLNEFQDRSTIMIPS